jgi:hypothetical protein
MLTKDDLKQINNIVQEAIKQGFLEFYDGFFEPYATKNENEHLELKEHIIKLEEGVDEVKEYIKDHDQRIEKLEAITPLNN